MMKRLIAAATIALTCVCAFTMVAKDKPENTEKKVAISKVKYLYDEIDFRGAKSQLSKEVFAEAYYGYLNLREEGMMPKDNHILSVCDFSLSSKTPRLWIIDLDKKKLLVNSLVAHGQGTGEEFATAFSNRENSHQSSMGFFITEDTYNGNNGYSLRLEGMDKGYNDKARDRAIVIHGADYVSTDFIANNQRLGRSWGCPALPRETAVNIINTIKGGSVFFIHYPDAGYMTACKWFNRIPETLAKPDLSSARHRMLQAQMLHGDKDTENIKMYRQGQIQ